MVAGSAFGLANLKGQRNASTDVPTTTLEAQLTADQAISERSVIIQQVAIAYREDGPFLGVTITGYFTDTPASDVWETIT